jgi:Family of unknown function (DUF6011)
MKGPGMTTRQRDYRKHPHKASFLMTFHTAQTEAERDQAALEFVTGGGAVEEPVREPVAAPAPRNDGSYVCEIKGHKVRCGGGYVSEAQAKWIIDIATTRVIPEGRTAESVLIRLEQGFAKFAGSQFITNYKDLPRITPAMVEAVAPGAGTEEFKAAQSVVKTRPEVADGRYAVEHEGTLKFYRLKNGRKAGFVFLDVQASDDWHQIRNPRRIDEILALIVEAGELNAARRYGIELGKCSRCGRTLTNEESRAYGIGPECRNK